MSMSSPSAGSTPRQPSLLPPCLRRLRASLYLGLLLPVRFPLTAPSRKAVRSPQSVKSRTTPLAVLLTSAESDVGRADGHFTALFRLTASAQALSGGTPATAGGGERDCRRGAPGGE